MNIETRAAERLFILRRVVFSERFDVLLHLLHEGRRMGDGDVSPVGHGEELHVVFRDADLAVIEAVRPLPEGHAPAEGVNDPGDGVAPGAEDLCSPENRTAFSCSILHDFLNFSVIYPPFGCCSFPGTAKIFYNHICSFDPIQFICFFY